MVLPEVQLFFPVTNILLCARGSQEMSEMEALAPPALPEILQGHLPSVPGCP